MESSRTVRRWSPPEPSRRGARQLFLSALAFIQLFALLWLQVFVGIRGCFFIENSEFSDFARKCTETWHVASHAGDGARQHLANQHRN